MAIFGNITKYKEERKFLPVQYYNKDKDDLIQEAIKEARSLGFTENCTVELLNGQIAQLRSFNRIHSLAYDDANDKFPKVCRVFYKKGNDNTFESIDHNELSLTYTHKNHNFG